jgi:hypothetical protein
MSLDIFDCSCGHCKTPYNFNKIPESGMDFNCNSCGRWNRVKGFKPTNGKVILIVELIEEDEHGLY